MKFLIVPFFIHRIEIYFARSAAISYLAAYFRVKNKRETLRAAFVG